jgi:hypothetical protein
VFFGVFEVGWIRHDCFWLLSFQHLRSVIKNVKAQRLKPS